ncbi:MAG: nicotinamide riboside transporter PnuC [Steroidobacteraceae bacterium]|jgi:nicotinamide mononucleotide transporter
MTFAGMSPLEIIAVIVTIIGVWLMTARSLWNYPFSFLSVALYAVFFYRIKLYADMGLQCIFAGTLLYGLWQWTHGRSASGEVVVARIQAREVAVSVAAALIVALGLGAFLYKRTDASFPWSDSMLLAGSLVGSVWGARRYLENWWVWILVDTLYVGLYVAKQAYPTAALYAAFVVLAALGWRRWQTAYAAQGRDAERPDSRTEPAPGTPPAANLSSLNPVAK